MMIMTLTVLATLQLNILICLLVNDDTYNDYDGILDYVEYACFSLTIFILIIMIIKIKMMMAILS